MGFGFQGSSATINTLATWSAISDCPELVSYEKGPAKGGSTEGGEDWRLRKQAELGRNQTPVPASHATVWPTSLGSASFLSVKNYSSLAVVRIAGDTRTALSTVPGTRNALFKKNDRELRGKLASRKKTNLLFFLKQSLGKQNRLVATFYKFLAGETTSLENWKQ